MLPTKRILVTGATGKVGQTFIRQLFHNPAFDHFVVRALLHNRGIEPRERLETVRGSIQHQEVVQEAMRDVTHVLHLATVKETPAQIMDTSRQERLSLLFKTATFH